ncbi:HAD family hydrolase [Sphingomonas azotifigens]|uniref:HAD family hydrolase n=1 Tax=Sphingomonas azotifigens TaxID=330920 RepID=UPI0009FE2FDA|nr:HAD family hydrolase [Sphingomonas azotifigens]
MIAAILFDLDETLHDRAASLRSFLLDQHRRWFPGHVAQHAFVAQFLALDAHGSLAKPLLYPRLLAALGITGRDADMLAADYAAGFRDHVRPMDGVAALLPALRARGLRLGIISNGATAFQHRTIDALGIRAAFDAILISEAEQLRKPDPRLFHRATERLGVSPERCVFVGDHPEADVRGAMAAGMGAIWFRRAIRWPETLPAPPATIESLSALPPLLEAALEQAPLT